MNKMLLQIERTTLIQIDGHFGNKIYPANMFHDPLFFAIKKQNSNPAKHSHTEMVNCTLREHERQ